MVCFSVLKNEAPEHAHCLSYYPAACDKISTVLIVTILENCKAEERKHFLSSPRSSLEYKMEESGFLQSYHENLELFHQLDQMFLG